MKTFSVKLMYAYKFISQCLPIYAFYTILFIERGLSINAVAVLIALWSAFAIVFEMPSGILADRWNRRNMLVLSAVLQGLCFVVWYFSHTFSMFAIGFVFWGMSGAFVSGTEEGLIYDNLKSDGREEDFTKIYGKARFFGNAGILAGIASAGVIASFISIGAIALISAAICFTNAILASFLREKNYYAQRTDKESGGYLETIKEAVSLFRGSKLALISVLFLVLFASLGDYLDEFDALIINDFQLNTIWVSVILTVRFVFVALGNLVAPKMQRKVSSVRQIVLLGGLACALLALFAVIWSRYAIPLFGLSCMFMSITEVLFVNIMQSEINDEGRATMMSFYGAGQNIVMICFSLVYAFLAGIFTLQQTYVMISVYGVIGACVFVCVFKSMSTDFTGKKKHR